MRSCRIFLSVSGLAYCLPGSSMLLEVARCFFNWIIRLISISKYNQQRFYILCKSSHLSWEKEYERIFYLGSLNCTKVSWVTRLLGYSLTHNTRWHCFTSPFLFIEKCISLNSWICKEVSIDNSIFYNISLPNFHNKTLFQPTACKYLIVSLLGKKAIHWIILYIWMKS